MNLRRCIAALSVALLFFAAPRNGLAQSPDCGITWNPIQQLSSDRVLSLTPQLAISGDTVHAIWYGWDTLGTESSDGIQYSRSTDGGMTFSPQTTISALDTAVSPALIASWGANVYIAFLGIIDTFYGALVVRSTDAGISWSPPERVRTLSFPRILQAEGDTVLLYYYDLSTVSYGMLVSTDGGQSWEVRAPRGAPALNSFVTTSGVVHGVFATAPPNADIYYWRSTNFGLTWIFGEVLSPEEDFVNSTAPRIATNRSLEYYAVWNDEGVINLRRSRNGGYAWLPQVRISPGSGAVFADVAADEEFVCVVWDQNTGDTSTVSIRSSNDFGYTFCPAEEPTASTRAGEPSLKMSGRTVHLIWSDVFNGNSEIGYRRGTMTKNPKFGGKPTAYALDQNFPNPFNDLTNIRFDLPVPAHVNLAVYDILGRRVAQLLDEDLAAGTHDVRFSARFIASGVYYYYLRTPAYTETKKLLIAR